MHESKIQRQAEVTLESAGQRADKVAASLFDEFSRTQLQEWMLSKQLTANFQPIQPKQKLMVGQILRIDATPAESERWEAQAIPLKVVFEDESVLVVNKPAGMVVHPAAGNPDGTLLNALLAHAPQVDQLPRCGIVHRLDKDTTGLLVVAKTLQAQTGLVRQLQARSMHRQYQAVCSGAVTAGGKVDKPIGRHPRQRTKMAVVGSGKPAVTHYRVAQRFAHFTHLRLELETGRTHQIRVHMAQIKHPLVGDQAYAGRLKIPAGTTAELDDFLRGFKRQALHASQLKFVHPANEGEVSFDAPLPDDFEKLLRLLSENESN